MPFDPILERVVVVLLAVALAIFGAHLLRGRRTPRGGDFGAGFSAFLAAWIGAELAAAFAPVAWAEGVEILHFLILAAFAGWMNVRWVWALRRAQEVD